MREGPLARVGSRGAQRVEGPATDQRIAKRGGCGAEALPTHAGANHGEAEAQEGQVGRWSSKPWLGDADRFSRG